MADDKRVTLSGQPANPDVTGAPQPINPDSGQHRDYYILSDEERAKGFVKPVRLGYKHNVCGSETQMGLKIAETYARDPYFYSSTFCYACRTHLPLDQFSWLDGEPMKPADPP